jgi:zinc protease
LAEAKLPNGVRVVVAERHALPLVSVALYLHLGSAADPDGRAGLASLTNDLRTQGATVAASG